MIKVSKHERVVRSVTSHDGFTIGDVVRLTPSAQTYINHLGTLTETKTQVNGTLETIAEIGVVKAREPVQGACNEYYLARMKSGRQYALGNLEKLND